MNIYRKTKKINLFKKAGKLTSLTLISLTLVIAFLISGCSDAFMEFGKPEVNSGEAGTGRVTITIGTLSGERTLRPDDITELSEFDRIDLVLRNDDLDQTIEVEDITEGGQAEYQTDLEVGQWTITAEGYITINEVSYKAAHGSIDIDVARDDDLQRSIDLETGVLEGLPGIFNYDISFPNEVQLSSIGALSLTSFDAVTGTSGDPITRNIINTRTGSIELQPGFYLLNVHAYDNQNRGAYKMDMVHIYSGRETEANITFISTDFTAAQRMLGGEAAITGATNYRIGEELGVNVSAITGAALPYNYQWRRGGSNITGATGATYTITGADAGSIISCDVTHEVATGSITATGLAVPYEVVLNITSNDTGDSITRTPEFGAVGTSITLDYTVASVSGINELSFSGVAAAIALVPAAGTGTRMYNIAVADATNGVITINAAFNHEALAGDNIGFVNTDNVTRIYGNDNNIFTRALTNTGSGTGSITYASSDPAVATVTNTGAVTVLKVGTTVITATKAADIAYEGANASYTLTVTQRPVTITGLVAPVARDYNGGVNAVVTGTPVVNNIITADTGNVTFEHDGTVFEDKDEGNDKLVIFTNWRLGGSAAGNYSLAAPPTLRGNVRQLQLTRNALNVTTTKTFNNNNIANFTGGEVNNIVQGDTVTVTITATYNSMNVPTATLITVVTTISGTDAHNYIPPANFEIPGTITRAAGSAVEVPTMLSYTFESITSNPVNLLTSTGQDIEYAISDTTTPPTAESEWRLDRTFTGLSGGTGYYLFARSRVSDNYNTGVHSVSAMIMTVVEEVNQGLTLNITTNIPDLGGSTLTITGNVGFNLNAGDVVTFTADEGFTMYSWVIGAEIVAGENARTFTIRAIDFTQGEHHLMVIATKDGIPYSANVYFTVLN